MAAKMCNQKNEEISHEILFTELVNNCATKNKRFWVLIDSAYLTITISSNNCSSLIEMIEKLKYQMKKNYNVSDDEEMWCVWWCSSIEPELLEQCKKIDGLTFGKIGIIKSVDKMQLDFLNFEAE